MNIHNNRWLNTWNTREPKLINRVYNAFSQNTKTQFTLAWGVLCSVTFCFGLWMLCAVSSVGPVLLRSVRTTEYNAVYMIFYGQLYGACTLHTVPRRKRVYIITCNSMQSPAGIILPKNVPCRCVRSDHAVRKPACCDKRVVYQWLIDRGSNRGTIGQTLYTSFIHQRTGSKVKKKETQETNSNKLD